ncbi:MAG TPA: hypothetical protein VLM36_02460 [Sphingomicrobium sp.]|nr:hypothetical protein [Sphingomicrobium sp.]
MPYPRAPFYMLGVIATIVVGFWPSYFAVAPTVPWQFHAHGVAASLWVLMVTAQSWTAQHKNQLQLHRAVGKASLFLFPFLIGGLAAIISRQSQEFVAGDPVRLLYGPGFLIGTMVAMAAYVTVYYRALKYRRKVWIHAGYMLSTPLILFESPFSRIMGLYIPRFQVHGPADFPHIMETILWSMALSLVISVVIWWRVRERAKPFLVTAGFIAVELLATGFASDFPVLRQLDTFIGHAPVAPIWLMGFTIGALTSWAGWQAGKRPTVTVAAAAVPA